MYRPEVLWLIAFDCETFRYNYRVYQKYLSTFGFNIDFMGEIIIRPITSDGKITIPKDLIEKFNLKDSVEIEETLCNKGILIKKHE